MGFSGIKWDLMGPKVMTFEGDINGGGMGFNGFAASYIDINGIVAI